MEKMYKGWELMKAIADGKIKNRSKFIFKTEHNMKEEVLWDGEVFLYANSEKTIVSDYTDIRLIQATFELIEDEKDIDNIKELYINDKTKSVGKDAIANWTGRNLDITFANKMNEILQAVKQIDKRVKKLED